MSKTIAEAITALAAKVKGSAVTPADGTKVAALDALVDAMAGSDVPMPQWSTVAEAIDLVTANYTPGGGGGDFTTATVTFANGSGDGIDAFAPTIDSDEAAGKVYISTDGGNIVFILYKGSAYLSFVNELAESSVSVTGALELDAESPDVYGIYITGDGTVTIS